MFATENHTEMRVRVANRFGMEFFGIPIVNFEISVFSPQNPGGEKTEIPAIGILRAKSQKITFWLKLHGIQN